MGHNQSSPLSGEGLTHNIRNVVNGLTPDVLVIFGGGGGTLAEAAFAVAANKPIFFCDLPASHTRLVRNFKKHFVDSKDDVDLYLQAPLAAGTYRDAWHRPLTVNELKNGLANFLKITPGAFGPVELVKKCVAAAKDAALGPTGFPGLPKAPETKARFEAIIKRISNPIP